MTLVCLLAVGILRNALQIALGISDGQAWYTWRWDITLCMAVYPVYLCFHSYSLLTRLGKRLGWTFHKPKLLRLLIYIQSIHLAVPFIDWIGKQIGFPIYHQVFHWTGPQWLADGILEASLGIVVGWMVVFGIIYIGLQSAAVNVTVKPAGKSPRESKGESKVKSKGESQVKSKVNWGQKPIGRTVLLMITVFPFLYFPIYHLHPLFFTGFRYLTFDTFQSYWLGYGVYFSLMALIGLGHVTDDSTDDSTDDTTGNAPA